MRLAVVLLVCSLLAAAVAAWEKLDHEIFELYDDIKRHEDTADWYEFLGIDAKSGVEDINKAYRQLSKKYHPDKLQRLSAAESKKATKRFQRMGLVVGIMRDSESRKRYNFFRKNGVPAWRGTGYLYRRWRPGFGSVMVGLVLFASAMQYLFHQLSYWRAQQRIKAVEEHESRAGGRLKVKREQTAQQAARRKNRRQKNGGSPNNTEVEDSGFEAEELGQFQVNTVGVINPYAVKPASIGRLFVVTLPLALAQRALVLAGLRSPAEERPAAEPADNDGDGDADANDDDDAHQQAIADALRNASSSGGEETGAVAASPEAKAKKAARKAAKAQARRRRMPVV
ncbi:hypothetical protein LPJ61_005776 [Coemansia biformis]|uniref:J domain-containing protein n=1 Tax=Coemansia biformis TaxID=1286918 RepID=A0A9W8CUP4_9FUNG|nr:hypothetical protein LPJ61_005776 [Coemansia biformis]